MSVIDFYIAKAVEAAKPVVEGLDPFNRQHGSLYDRGRADSYYGRPRRPHYGGVGSDFGGESVLIPGAWPEAEAEYNQGFDDNEADFNFKDWF